MRRTEEVDPLYYQAYTRWDVTDELMAVRRPSEGEASSHLWTGAISTELPVGVHTLYVRATDMFGRVFTHEQTIRIEKAIALPKIYNYNSLLGNLIMV